MNAAQTAEMKLIHTMAHALRHDPAKYDLEPDAGGWVSFDDLTIALRYERREWMNLERHDIIELLAAMESDRFEVRDNRIRAAYGHSILLEAPPAIKEPPEFLFHGTAQERVAEIMATGLLRMGRQFVHLSSDIDWVARFVADKPHWVILRALACQARRQGVCFRQANGHVWLADSIAPQFLSVEQDR